MAVEQKGLWGSAQTRIDEKGRIKVPSLFRGYIQDLQGPDVFVTSVTGESVLIYPMSVWLENGRKLAAMPGNHPLRQKYLDRVNYYGQLGELDAQGRVIIPLHLREKASIVGDVRVFGRLDYLEVWNELKFNEKLDRDAWTSDDGLRLAEHGI